MGVSNRVTKLIEYLAYCLFDQNVIRYIKNEQKTSNNYL